MSTLIVDFEFGRDGSFYAAAAKRGASERLWEPPVSFERAHAELVAWSLPGDVLVGHNLHRFDAPELAKRRSESPLLALPQIDTLELSVLAFPRRPYHRLVKDDDLVRNARPRPRSDVRAAYALLDDALRELGRLEESEARLLAALLSNVDHTPATAAGWRWLFSELGWSWGEPVSSDGLRQVWRDRVCPRSRAFDALGIDMRLVFVSAWLRVAAHEDGSVLPAWVRRQFPGTPRLIRDLRGVRCEMADCGWCASKLDGSAWLTRIFGYNGFRATPATPDGRSLQEELVGRGLRGDPTFGILPTGAGKSLCFQIPAEARHRLLGQLTLVISPLQSLMKDQVDALKEKIPTARAIYGGLPSVLRPQVFQEVRIGLCGLLYVSPEQLRNASVLRLLSTRELGAIVFDEAHCLSQWGHDFRTDYPYGLKALREICDDQGIAMPPVFLFTATTQHDATNEILAHVQAHTGQAPTVYDGGFARENLIYEVRHVPEHDRLSVIVELLVAHLGTGSAIVFCGSRRRTEETAELLEDSGFPARAYHAGLDPDRRRTLQEQFLAGQHRVITATNAFGMGVDKDDVRVVVHLDMPSSLEAYLQEAGRAGRDRQPAIAVLLWAPGDAEARFRLGAMSKLSVEDLAALWRGIQRLPAQRVRGREQRVVTSRELLVMPALQGHFEPSDEREETRVKAAVNWLERSAVLERRQNVTHAFSGRPRLPSLDACRDRMMEHDLSEPEIRRRTIVLRALYDAGKEGLDADRVAELARELGPDQPLGGGLRVLAVLKRLAESGLVTEGQTFSAFLRIGTPNPSGGALRHWRDRERQLLDELAGADGFLQRGDVVNLRSIATRLSTEERSCTERDVAALLRNWAFVGRGQTRAPLAPEFRPLPGQRGRLILNLSLDQLTSLVLRRHQVAEVVLRALLSLAGERGSEVHVATDLETLTHEVASDLGLRGALVDLLEAVRTAIAWMNDLHVLTVQNGLAIFRSAMQLDREEGGPTLSGPRARGARDALRRHQEHKVLRVHVMDAWAQSMLADPQRAERMRASWFDEPVEAFVQQWFRGRKADIVRPTTAGSYDAIVTALNDGVQQKIVTRDARRNHLVVAGPGSGKTRVLVHRVAWLLRVHRVRGREILVVCYTRANAVELRRRLAQLVGDDARGVRIQTLHSVAMGIVGPHRLTPTGELTLFTCIDEATRLLRGQNLDERDRARQRDSLLRGRNYLFVDEYQDLDEGKYALLTAMAGRLLGEGHRKLRVFAVGDDDQAIFAHDGAKTQFIRAFEKEYAAERHIIRHNYRNPGAVLDLAQRLLGGLSGRIKGGQPLVVDDARRDDPPIGPWAAAHLEGRIPWVQTQTVSQAAARLVDVVWNWVDRGMDATRIAILARTRPHGLHPLRVAAERARLSFRWTLPSDETVPVFRIRELAQMAEFLRSHDGFLPEAQIRRRIEEMPTNDWSAALLRWLEPHAGRRWAVDRWGADLHVWMRLERSARTIGQGVHLGTMHTAKGLEFDHVLLLDDGRMADNEDERRLLYVAVTRARQSLQIFSTDRPSAGFQALSHPLLAVQRTAPLAAERTEDRDYGLLGRGDIWIDWLGRQDAAHPGHQAMARAASGDPFWLRADGPWLSVVDREGVAVAKVAKDQLSKWKERMTRGLRLKMLAVLLERRDEGHRVEPFREQLRHDQWWSGVWEARWSQ